MTHELPELGYKYDALEPYIDAKTMEIHHTKHHQAYIDKLNAAIKGSQWEQIPVSKLLEQINSLPENIRTAVRNHGGGHYNHSMFWKIMKKDVKISEKIEGAINKDFVNFDNFKKQFTNSSVGLFGSGWAWLVLNGDKLEILNLPNQDNPLSQGKIPILGVDLWEHNYYLRFQNRRAEYLDAFFQVINWKFIEELYVLALKGESFSVKPV